MGRVWGWALALPVLLWIGCGGEATGSVRVDLVPAAPPAAERFPQDESGEPIVPIVHEPVPIVLPPPPSGDIFQPGFFQNLRASKVTDGRVTLRFKVPVVRSGKRLRIAVRAGTSALTVYEATVARAGEGGSLGERARQLRFGGSPRAEVEPRGRLVSDALDFEVAAPMELMVSLDVEGGLAASLIDAFPHSFIAPAGQAWHTHLNGSAPHRQLWALTAVFVEGPAERVVLAIGDSITEGYVGGDDDVRDAWPNLAAVSSGVPVVNGAVSGQGIYSANDLYRDELQWLSDFDVTHCLVLLGTNDLAALDAGELKSRLTGFFDRLRPLCEVWAGTLIPRERADGADLEAVHARRAELNAWLREGASGRVKQVVDFDAATRSDEDPDRFREGFGYDGIHPSVAGQRAMGAVAAQALSRLR